MPMQFQNWAQAILRLVHCFGGQGKLGIRWYHIMWASQHTTKNTTHYANQEIKTLNTNQPCKEHFLLASSKSWQQSPADSQNSSQ